jgi:uncharacterized protein YbjT (DUF2867 family)
LKKEFDENKGGITKRILVTGATGYIAARLIPILLRSGYRVRAMGRSIKKMADRSWGTHPDIELVKGDILDRDSLEKAVHGCGTVYYLVHSMISKQGEYKTADRIGAENMAAAAEAENAEHIIYLGGLGDITDKNASRHLISRNEVGEILKKGSVPVTILRAAMILGSGSASFEILRYLAERLPVMITPKWVSMPTQPIAVSNVLGYLTGCIDHPQIRGMTFDIGGPDVYSYRELFKIFAEEADLTKPVMIPVPVLTPRLSSLWIHLVTPVPASIAQPLAEGLSIPTICTENRITKMIPQKLVNCREAIRRTLQRTLVEQIDDCRESSRLNVYPEWSVNGDAGYSGGTLFKMGYRTRVKGSRDNLWEIVEKIGGEQGYYGGNTLWKIRGAIDRLSGGVGLLPGRGSNNQLKAGDIVDFWQVFEVVPSNSLILVAKMKSPGEAFFQIRLKPCSNQEIELMILSFFKPKGIAGILYWYLLYPFHQWVFNQMSKGMTEKSGLKQITWPQQFEPVLATSCILDHDKPAAEPS